MYKLHFVLNYICRYFSMSISCWKNILHRYIYDLILDLVYGEITSLRRENEDLERLVVMQIPVSENGEIMSLH